ncbi:forkhead box protein O isoform X2 [Nematostella vectensis]|uniref:forkhead box protein O isoform X2 n=1 Tax=Nematostella vectensis TaxID=45351 RepID=UPI0020775581|nr:forkhead box protein O isoform X2 [Nematostella vectensis]
MERYAMHYVEVSDSKRIMPDHSAGTENRFVHCPVVGTIPFYGCCRPCRECENQEVACRRIPVVHPNEIVNLAAKERRVQAEIEKQEQRSIRCSVIVQRPQLSHDAVNDIVSASASCRDTTYDDQEKEKKKPWGNASYSDLIARAITQSTKQKLTLPQIYEWFVDNVSYFRDREHLPSTKGWKNAIRHTLSLRQRFVRTVDPTNPYRSWWSLASEKLRKERRMKPRWKSRGTQTTLL